MRIQSKAASAGLVAGLAAIVVSAELASAQTMAQEPAPASVRRPYRGIYGAPVDPSQGHALVLSGSVFGAYDDNVIEALSDGRSRNWLHQQSGRYAGAHAGLDYAFSHSGERISFGARSAAQLRYYDRGEDTRTSAYYSGSLSMDSRLSQSTTLSVLQTASYAPGYSFLLTTWPGEEPLFQAELPPDPDTEAFQLEALHLNSRVTLSQRFGRSTQLSGGYEYRQVDFQGEEQPAGRFLDYRTHAGFARLGYQRALTPYAALNLGYGVRVSDRHDRSGRPRVLHDVQAGISYGRPLSASRRTFVRFSSGSTVAVQDELGTPDVAPTTMARLIGSATLEHEMGRTWTARAAYRRGLTFREGFDDFFFTDGLTADLNGLVTRRLAFTAAGTWSFSRLQRPGLTRHTAFSGSAQATFALSRYLGLFARYLYYDYDFGDDIPLDNRIPRALERHAVRVGVSTSIPLIR